jgi:alpha-beta hydrolase superfamily lysophospholipase
VTVVNHETDLPAERRGFGLWVRVTGAVLGGAAVLFLGIVSWLFVSQHSMIYHPRPYGDGYAQALPSRGAAIDYLVPFGKQTAYYVPTSDQLPKRIWVAFCGNASLALDWTTALRGYPENGDAFLLVDYPGYGRNAGYASVESTEATANAALNALLQRLDTAEDRLSVCAMGHSLGAAAALEFAAHHPVKRVLLISPFTTLREEAACVVGSLLSRIVVDNYDNRENLRTVFRQNPDVQVAMFHGTDDDVIPVRMSRQLKHEFQAADFFPVKGADHVTVLEMAQKEIIGWMTR